MSSFGDWFMVLKSRAPIIGANQAVDQAIEHYSTTGAVPDVDEAVDFLSTFADWVGGETKSSATNTAKSARDPRARAILYIKDFYEMQPGAKVAFQGISLAFFVIDLAVRIRRPRTIDQASTGLCGAAAFIYNFAKTEPEELAKFALRLFCKGTAKLKQMDVTPTQQILASYSARSTFIPHPVDYVLLCSLRQCAFDPVQLIQARNETTLPGQMGEWLRKAGYTEIQADTFFNLGWGQTLAIKAFASNIEQPMHHGHADRERSFKKAVTNLKRAAAALASGKVVVLFGAGEVTKFMAGQIPSLPARTDWANVGEHHWVAARKITVTETHVTLRVVSWEKRLEKTMPLTDFIYRYNGYLAARP